MKIGFVSLGCAKNRVDAEVMMGLLQEAGHELVPEAARADAIVVNTCGFIASAKQEAIDAIFEMAAAKREDAALLVSGCLAQRNSKELFEEIPELDAVIGIGEIGNIVRHAEAAFEKKRFVKADAPFVFPCGSRVLTTPGHYAYLKVSDGCDNRCAYCAIPGIRGPMLSRPMEELIEEARILAKGGAKEIILIAQDTTRYGMDIYQKPMLGELLEELCKIEEVSWIRALYLYPEMIDRALLERMSHPKVCRYLDVSIQHSSDRVLRAMNRRGGRDAIENAVSLAREYGFTLRTTVLVGFPGETEEDFEALMAFLRDHPFDRLGAFAYSREEGTPAHDMPEQVPAKVKKARERQVMSQQQEISRALLQGRVGTVCRVLVEGEQAGRYIGRSAAEAPEIDGLIYFTSDRELRPGDFCDVDITATREYDLEGVLP